MNVNRHNSLSSSRLLIIHSSDCTFSDRSSGHCHKRGKTPFRSRRSRFLDGVATFKAGIKNPAGAVGKLAVPAHSQHTCVEAEHLEANNGHENSRSSRVASKIKGGERRN